MRLRREGQSVVEVIFALAVFAIVSSTVITTILSSFSGTIRGQRYTQATALAREGFEAVRSIHDDAWNRVEFNQSAVSVSGSQWIFDGESTTEGIGDFTRTINFSDVCRDVSDDIVSCASPGAVIDVHAQEVSVTVSWINTVGTTSQVQYIGYLTNWDADEWIQTDWVGGSGQTIWSDTTRYDSDDGNMNVSVAGQASLTGSSGCGAYSWPFTTPANYTYNAADIEVTGGVAQLVGTVSGSTTLATAVTDTLEFDITNGETPSVVQVDSDTYAVAYDGPGADGWVATFDVDTAGNIGASTVDVLEFDTGNGEAPSMIAVDTDTFAVAYDGPGADGWLATFDIDTAGNITPVIDTLEFDTSNGNTPSLVQVDTDTFAVAYTGAGSDGWLATVDIDSSGNIAATVTDTLEFNTTNGHAPSMVQVDTDTYAIAYTGNNNDGFITTVDIDAAGNIAATITDTLEYDTLNGDESSLIQVDTDTYAVAYRGDGNDGWLATVDIDAAGNIAATVTDTLEFDPTNGYEPDIMFISGDLYAIAYRSPSNTGYIIIFDIDSTGNISATVTDTLEYDVASGSGYDPSIVLVDSDTILITYTGVGTDGWSATVDLVSGVTYPSTDPTIEPVSSYVPSSADVWASFTETATKSGSSEIYYQLSDDNGSTWQYWDGAAWSGVVGVTDYNTASVVNTNISSFPTTANQIMFKAFLSSSGSDQVQLDEVQVTCASVNDWPFTTPANYTYNAADIEVTGGVAQLVSGGTPASGDTLDDAFDYTADTTYDWPFTTPANYTYNAADIEVTGGVAQLVSSGAPVTGDTVNPDFTSNANNWTFTTWDVGGGEVTPTGSWQSVGGNPTGYVDVTVPSGRNDEVGGYWEQSFTTTIDNPTVADIDFDWSSIDFNGTPNVAEIRVFVDTASGTPTTQVGSSITVSGTTGWASATTIDATSAITTAGTYYLKIAYWIETPNKPTAGTGPFTVGFDNAQLHWEGTVTSYPTDEPDIYPVNSLSVVDVQSWDSFTETATKAGSSEIYYQLSDDNGSTWQYWDGAAWSGVVGVTDYNTASVVNTNIGTFSTTTEQIKFRAFLESNGTEQVQLDNIQIGFTPPAGVWSFATWDVGGGEVTPTGTRQTSGGNPGNYVDVTVPAGSNDEVGGYWEQAFTTTADNPTVADIDFDWSSIDFNGAPNVAEIRVFVDTASGTPTTQVGSSITVSGTTGWASATTIDATSAITTAGTYYLKIAYWVETPSGGGAGPVTVGFDNATLHWEGIVGGSYPTTGPTIEPTSSYSPGTVSSWVGFVETATKAGTSEIYYQLSDDDGTTWQYWDGAAWSNVVGATDFNTASVVNTNISSFSTTANQIMFKAFLSSNGTDQVQLDNVRVLVVISGGGGGGFSTSGWLLSSAFDMGDSSPVQVIEWDEALPSCAPSCTIQFQVRTAPDNAGSPGTWTSWYRATGVGTYFTDSNGALIPTALNGNQWMQYRVEFAGDGTNTPTLYDVTLNYR